MGESLGLGPVAAASTQGSAGTTLRMASVRGFGFPPSVLGCAWPAVRTPARWTPVVATGASAGVKCPPSCVCGEEACVSVCGADLTGVWAHRFSCSVWLPSHSDHGINLLQSESLQVTQHVWPQGPVSDLPSVCPRVVSSAGERRPRSWHGSGWWPVSARSMVTVPDRDAV